MSWLESASSIRRRLLLILLAPLTLLLALGVLVDYRNSADLVRSAYDLALANETQAVTAHLRPAADGTVRSDLSPQAVEVLRADNYDQVFYLVTGPEGRFVAGDAGLPVAPAGAENPAFRDATFHDRAIRAATYRMRAGSSDVAVTVAETLHKREYGTRRILSGVLLTDVFQLCATLVLIWFGVRYGLRPLLALRDQIAARSARELTPLDERNVPLEVVSLTQALNRLLAAVRDTAYAQQRFLADAAHQLRTPLAGVQAQLELLANEAAPGETRARLISLHEACRRLAHTANQLLTLARAEPSANFTGDFQSLDLQTLVEEAVAGNLDRALARQIDLGAESMSVRVPCVAWLLREMLANLVDNALVYAATGGRVTVRCGIVENAASPTAFLEVEDDGPGIPEAERGRVTERFYRSAASRGNGCGLGLAIVEDIARLHGAVLEIFPGSANPGTRVRVRFSHAGGAAPRLSA
ncbi:MAG TPA: sensor histidine kinase N-terminal domain-containing protein [Rudaea sp.]|nr:sensor histidine kinase N-terminal domain-containing protein [Rudaea sp.]